MGRWVGGCERKRGAPSGARNLSAVSSEGARGEAKARREALSRLVQPLEHRLHLPVLLEEALEFLRVDADLHQDCPAREPTSQRDHDGQDAVDLVNEVVQCHEHAAGADNHEYRLTGAELSLLDFLVRHFQN